MADEEAAEKHLRSAETSFVLERQRASDSLSAVVKAEELYEQLVKGAEHLKDPTMACLQQAAFRISAAEELLTRSRVAHSEQQRRLLHAEQEVARRKHELLDAHAKVQAFETLRDRQRAEFQKQQALAEEAELEETARQVHARSQLTVNPHDVI